MSEEISGWNAFVAFLARTRGLVPGDGFGDEGVVRFPVPFEPAPLRAAAFRLRAKSQREWVALAFKICPAGRIRPTSVVTTNGGMVVGSLCFAQDHLVVRQTLPLDGLRSDHVDQTLAALVETYRGVQEVAGGRPPPSGSAPHPFAMLVH